MSLPSPLKQYHFHVIQNWWHSPFNNILKVLTSIKWCTSVIYFIGKVIFLNHSCKPSRYSLMNSFNGLLYKNCCCTLHKPVNTFCMYLPPDWLSSPAVNCSWILKISSKKSRIVWSRPFDHDLSSLWIRPQRRSKSWWKCCHYWNHGS
jgi:hypothetical protein